MADFEVEVTGAEVKPWADPPAGDLPSRLNPYAGQPERRLVATGGPVTLKARVGGVLAPLDTELGGRLFVAGSTEQAHPWPVGWTHTPGRSSIQSFWPQRAGHYLVYLRRPGGGAIGVHVEAPEGLDEGREEDKDTPNWLRATPGGPRLVRAWYSARAGVGAWTPDNGSIGSLSTWNQNNLTIGTGISDPDGGSNAISVTESVDGAPTGHHISKLATAYVPTLTYVDIWLKPVDRDWTLFSFSGAVAQGYINLRTGATSGLGADFAAEVLIDNGEGDWKLWRLTREAPGVGSTCYIYSASDTPSYNYQGDGSEPFHAYDVDLIQPRISAWDDLSLLAMEDTLRGAHAAQGLDGQQPLKYTGFASLNGQAPVLHELGRAVSIDVTHPDVIAVGSGVEPPYAVLAVAGANDDGGFALCKFLGSGVFDVPLYANGANLESQRSGTTVVWSGAASLLATPQLVAVIVNTDRTIEVWIGGVKLDTKTRGAAGAKTMTSWIVGGNSSQGGKWGDIAVFAGQIPGLDAASRYAALRDQAGGAAMAARWGVTA